MTVESEEEMEFNVVVNHEEQYSIWPVQRSIPAGWKHEGTHGTKAECLRRIEEVWVDMRPLSLRRQMEESAAEGRTAVG